LEARLRRSCPHIFILEARLGCILLYLQQHPPILCHRKSAACNKPSITTLNLFGNIFGNNDDVEEDQKDLQENELARFSHILDTDTANPNVKFDSLSIMISEWSKLFTNKDKSMGLTTPVAVVELSPSPSDAPTDNDDEEDVTNVSGVQLLFQKSKTGGRSAYQDKDDEKYGDDDDNKDKEEEAISEGGVEVRVQQFSGGDLEVIASRCEMEEGTMVKEMSEQTIVDSLRKAVAAWKKEQSS